MSSRTHRGLIVFALLCVFTLQLVHVACVYSPNWDEAHHLYDGYNILTRHDYRLNAEVPPLVKITAALPILPMKLLRPHPQGESQSKEAFLEGREFVFANGADRVLFPARMACMIFTLVLAWLIYTAGRRIFGTIAGLMALAMFTFDPNVLAHGTLVSTDLGSACCIFAAVYAFYLYAREQRPAVLLLTGVLAGLAMVAKFTGILIAPMLLLLVLAEGAVERSWLVLAQRLSAALCVLLCGWIVIWAFYGFRFAPAPGEAKLSPDLAPYLESMPNPEDGVRLAAAAKYHLLPQAYIWGLANTKKTEMEYVSYFFGRIYRHGPWQYFPAAFLIKSTLPLLIFLLVAAFFWFRSPHRRALEACFLLIPVAVYFAVVTMSHFDIGARHLMPIYPFLYVIAGATAASAFRRGPVWTAVASTLLAWQVVTSVRVAPAYMAYGNEAWGGPSRVHRYLSDANTDWGQQLKAVKVYLDTNYITDCWFAYFATARCRPPTTTSPAIACLHRLRSGGSPCRWTCRPWWKALC